MKFTQKITAFFRDVTSLKGSRYKAIATTPRHFSLKDWRIALLETKNAIGTKNMLNLSAFIILLGATINHRLESRTVRKTANNSR